MKNLQKRLYEGMYILNASLSEGAMKKALSRITDSIEESGGEIHKIHDQGRKKLAYAINSSKQGYYFILYFSVIPSVITEMWREYQLNEDLIRFITLQVDKVEEKIQFQPLPEA